MTDQAMVADGVAGAGQARKPRQPGCIPSGEASFYDQLKMMWSAFIGSPLRRLLFWVGFGIFALIVATAFGQVLLNRWNQPFYDAIERKDMAGFLHQLVVFAEIAGALLVLNIAQGWLNRYLHIKLREGLVRDLLDEWMRPGRALKLKQSGEIGVNPDQRLHEDAWHLADLSADLGIGFVQAGVLLVSFIGVLWAISEGFVFHYGGRSFAIPGYMVWAALAYAGTASALSWLLARPLVRLNADHYAREAELRVSLVEASQGVEEIASAGREGATRGRLEQNLTAALLTVRRIMTAAIRLQWFTAGYGWVTVVAPIVIASPVYFAGDLTFGGLMMAAAAFTQVHSSLRWFVDNIGAIADWRATLMRVASFRLALIRVGEG
ncbi:SbmA/BacA-like family transporter [Mesorhizobium sp. KR9-304]|uniref:ABC transporter ATP-binding protein/permease n=1 Tax=Mesorhizobium sp. KR9-304 TaxID=3156614 RepID=UPI0032B5BBE9